MKRLMCFVMAVIISLGVFNVCLADAVDIATLTETEKRNLYDELGRYFFGSAY